MDRINFWLAGSQEKKEQAVGLVEKEYRKDGYITGPEKAISVFPVAFSPGSFVFTAEAGEKIIGTVTLVGDGDLGLPLDSIYKEEADGLRNKGKKIAEISQLAINRDFIGSLGTDKKKIQSDILISLFRLVFYCAVFRKITTLCIAVNPKHGSFYDLMGFQDFGPLKYYPTVNNAPALAKAIEINDEEMEKARENLIFREIVSCPIEDKFFKKNDKDVLIFQR